jgi:WhiB family redox-sensing transcriptional regulator
MTTMNLVARPSSGRDVAERGACLGEDPELFFPTGNTSDTRAQAERAKAVCHRCPVMDECRQWNIEAGTTSGVWGGTSEYDRGEKKRGREYARLTAAATDGQRLALEHGEDIILYHLLKASVPQLAGKYGATPAAVRCALRIVMPQTEARKGGPALERILVGETFRDLVTAGRTDQEIALMMRTQAAVVVEARRVLEHRLAAARRIEAGRTEKAAAAEGGAL